MLSDLTLVIPTHNRHGYLKRILGYYFDSGLEIIVVDSTSTPFEAATTLTVQYHHVPNHSYLQKMNLVAGLIKTKYTFICADDDFIVLSSALECVDFLEHNSDYHSVQGHWINFSLKEGAVSFTPEDHFPSFVGLDINNDLPSNRIKALFESYMFLFYAVHRTVNLKDTFENSHKFSDDFAGIWEFVLGMFFIMNGKYKTIPVFYGAREINNFSARHYMFSNIDFLQNSTEHNAEYDSLIELLASHLAKREDLDYSKASEQIKSILVPDKLSFEPEIPRYLVDPVPGPFKKFVNLFPFISTLKKYYSNGVYNSIYPINNLRMRTWKSQGFPVYNREARYEWKKIKSFIHEHKEIEADGPTS